MISSGSRPCHFEALHVFDSFKRLNFKYLGCCLLAITTAKPYQFAPALGCCFRTATQSPLCCEPQHPSLLSYIRDIHLASFPKDNLFSLLLLQGTNVITNGLCFTKHRKRCQLLTRQNSWRVWLLFEMNEGTYKEKACQQIFLQKLRSGSHHWALTLFSRVHGRNLRLGGWISLNK